MLEISQEDAIVSFSKLTKPFLSRSVAPRSVIDAVASFYQDVRITGATIESDGDMLLLQWGTTKPNLITEFTDFRKVSDGDVGFDTREFQYFSLTRQIFAFGDKEEVEFDEEAVALCIELFFKEKLGGERSSNLWVFSPSEMSVKLDGFLQNSFIKTLVDSEPSSANAYVTYVG